MPEPVIDLLDHELTALAELASVLSADEWKQPTALPGWTVQDNVSHVIGTELMLAGEPAPEIDVSHLTHVRSPWAASLETWVEARRGHTGERVLAELREVGDRRVAQLRAMSVEDLDRVGWSPIGDVPYREFMRLRVFDIWMHEQDIRRATDRRGHLDGPVIEVALDRFEHALPYVIGKKAAAPNGTTVVFVIEAPRTRMYAVVVDGRARMLPTADAPEDPTVAIRLPIESFVALGGGRWTRAEAEAAGGIEVGGDEELAITILDHLAFTP